ncbi:Ku protein [Pandoraea horticolens]|uniref:Ku protein n=1 Tax=Pandoraea horticolens TaxID=2508298 RepID=A0A5E4UVQ5_9BURK|nr:Ku protein [Pandoraea horticolens]
MARAIWKGVIGFGLVNVHGYEYEKGNYVVLSDDEIRSANPVATQTVDILALIDRKVASGQTREVAQIEASAPRLSSNGNVTDLMALLKQNPGTRGKREAVAAQAHKVKTKASGSAQSEKAVAKSANRKPGRKTAAKKTSAKRAKSG